MDFYMSLLFRRSGQDDRSYKYFDDNFVSVYIACKTFKIIYRYCRHTQDSMTRKLFINDIDIDIFKRFL